MGLHKLGVVKDIVDSAGMGVSYAYEDLVFLDHNAVLLQFTRREDTVLCHGNQEADSEELQEAIAKLKEAAATRDMQFVDGGLYALTQADDENIRIEFIAQDGES